MLSKQSVKTLKLKKTQTVRDVTRGTFCPTRFDPIITNEIEQSSFEYDVNGKACYYVLDTYILCLLQKIAT